MPEGTSRHFLEWNRELQTSSTEEEDTTMYIRHRQPCQPEKMCPIQWSTYIVKIQELSRQDDFHGYQCTCDFSDHLHCIYVSIMCILH